MLGSLSGQLRRVLARPLQRDDGLLSQLHVTIMSHLYTSSLLRASNSLPDLHTHLTLLLPCVSSIVF